MHLELFRTCSIQKGLLCDLRAKSRKIHIHFLSVDVAGLYAPGTSHWQQICEHVATPGPRILSLTQVRGAACQMTRNAQKWKEVVQSLQNLFYLGMPWHIRVVAVMHDWKLSIYHQAAIGHGKWNDRKTCPRSASSPHHLARLQKNEVQTDYPPECLTEVFKTMEPFVSEKDLEGVKQGEQEIEICRLRQGRLKSASKMAGSSESTSMPSPASDVDYEFVSPARPWTWSTNALGFWRWNILKRGSVSGKMSIHVTTYHTANPFSEVDQNQSGTCSTKWILWHYTFARVISSDIEW